MREVVQGKTKGVAARKEALNSVRKYRENRMRGIHTTSLSCPGNGHARIGVLVIEPKIDESHDAFEFVVADALVISSAICNQSQQPWNNNVADSGSSNVVPWFA